MKDEMHPAIRNKWIVTMLVLNMILWSILCVGLAITFAATMHPIALMFSLGFAVGTWWMKRLMLEVHADAVPAETTAQFRSRKRHAT